MISRNPDEDYHQGFKHVVKDEVFYKNVYKWFPNPTLPKEELTRNKKKLLGESFEKEGYIMFAITFKYILKSSKNENDESVKKIKAVSFKLNDNIELESYKGYLVKSSNPVMGINRGFMLIKFHPYSHTGHMVKYEQKKNTINGNALDKMIVLENHSCAPFLPNLTKEDYYYAK
jgi:hypothetical protein